MVNSIQLDNNTVVENHTDEPAPYFKIIRATAHGTVPYVVEYDEFKAMERTLTHVKP